MRGLAGGILIIGGIFAVLFLWRFIIDPLPQEEIDRRRGKPFVVEVDGVKAFCHYHMDTLVSWHTECVPVP